MIEESKCSLRIMEWLEKNQIFLLDSSKIESGKQVVLDNIYNLFVNTITI